MEWNEDKAQKVIKKHKSRFSLRLTFKITRVLAAIFLLYVIYMMGVAILYDNSKAGLRTEFYQKLAIDWTYPELSTDISVSSENNISPLLTQKITLPLTKRIGKKDHIVSELNLSKPIFHQFTKVDFKSSYLFESNVEIFDFYLPNENEKTSQVKELEAWETLEIVHEGNVGNLAFSTEKYYTPIEIFDLLSEYDVDILWMPLYMGEMSEYTEGGWGGDEYSISLSKPWGLSGARSVDDQFRETYSVSSLNNVTIKESEQTMLQNMEIMLAEKTGVAETLLETEHLQERYDYINEHGFKAYGAVVTGPVKELLKIQEITGIHSVSLGEIKQWNW